jgi:hypothetical protein
MSQRYSVRFSFRVRRRVAQSATRISIAKVEAKVAPDTARVHTPTMTLKNAALLALIGTILMTALLLWTFVLTFLNVLRDLVPAVTLFQSFVYAFGCFSVAVFFYLFHRAQ